MLRKESEVVPKGNDPVHQQDEFGFGQPTLVDPFRRLEKIRDRRIDVITRLLEQHLTSLEPGARQPRLAMMADRHANTKTREHTEGAAKAIEAMHGDSFSSRRVESGPKTNSTSFGMMAKPTYLPCKEDVLVENGDASPKSCLPSLKMRKYISRRWLTSHLFGSTRSRRRIQRRQIYGFQLHPPGMTTAVPA